MMANTHPAFGQFYLPLDAETIAEICGVSLRTAQRWWSRESTPPPHAVRLVKLVHGGRVMPDHWPQQWRFSNKTLQTSENEDAIRQQDIAAFHWVKNSWYESLALIQRTEQQVSALLPLLTEEQQQILAGHRDQLAEVRSRDHIAREWRLKQREKQRAHGC